MSFHMSDPQALPGLMAVFGAFFAFFLVFTLAVYIYMAFALMTIANKTGTKNGWLAFIPIANVYLMTQIVGISGWWTFGLLVVVIPFLGHLLLAAGWVFLYWKIAENVGRPRWWGILMLLPIVNLVLLGMMAWGTPQASKSSKKTGSKRK